MNIHLADLEAHDPGFLATRRAGRAAILAPLLLWVGKDVLNRPVLGTFAALGSIAMLILVDFGGPMSERIRAQSTLALSGAVLICLGTLTSDTTWVAGSATLLIAFAILFSGIFSSLLAGATTVLLISFVLPATLSGGSEAIPDRLLGWLLAGAASVLAVRLLWPAPTREPLRTLAAEVCRRYAGQLRSEALCVRTRFDSTALNDLRDLRAESERSAEALRSAFFATPYRPTGLSTFARAIVRTTDELIWLDRLFARASLGEPALPIGETVCELTSAAAQVLEEGSELLLAQPDHSTLQLADGIARLRGAREAMEKAITSEELVDFDLRESCTHAEAIGFVSSLQPSFRAQEISFIVSAIAENIQLAAAARERSWWQRVLGRGPEEHDSVWSSMRQRASAHLEPHSVWLHNSLRGAMALAVAVLVAKLSNVQHGFWVVFGTLAVLRSSALSTGQDAVRALSGTVAGILVGGCLVALLGADSTASWLVLIPAIALIALGPVTISFAVGQMGFTTALLIMNNIIVPAGWSTGLVRFEDVAIGCGVSIVVGALFWPRGAGRALGHALADGFSTGARYLDAAVGYGVNRCDSSSPDVARPAQEIELAGAAGRRVDDAFRAFLAERGTKRLSMADAAKLVGAASLLRLTADAVVDLWERDGQRRRRRSRGGTSGAARCERLLDRLVRADRRRSRRTGSDSGAARS